MLDKEQYSSDTDEIPQLVNIQQVHNANTTKTIDDQVKTEDTKPQQVSNSTKEEIERKKVLERSEARRRKILANAKERLAQLNGGVPPQKYDTFGDEEVSDPDVKPDIPEFLRPERQSTPLDAFADNFYENNSPNNDGADIQRFLNSMLDMQQQRTTPPNVKPENVWLNSRLHVVLIALLTFVLSIYDNGFYINGLSIFLLIGICLVSELLFFTRESKLHPLFDLGIMVLGLRPEVTKRVMNLLLLFHNIVTDLGIFVFSYCGISIAYILLINDTVDLVVIK